MYKILVVDDEKWIRKGIVKKIDKNNKWINEIEEAEDGLDALKKMGKNKYDIILADVKMPTIDGLELLRTVKNRFPDTHLVIISGYDEFEYVHQAIKIGVNDYLLKPVNEDELNELLKKIIKEIKNSKKQYDIEKDIFQLLISNKQPSGRFHKLIKRHFHGNTMSLIIIHVQDKSLYKKDDLKRFNTDKNQILVLNENKYNLDILVIGEDDIRFIVRRIKRYFDEMKTKYYMIVKFLGQDEQKDMHDTYKVLKEQVSYIKINHFNQCINSNDIIYNYKSNQYLLNKQQEIIKQIRLCDKLKVMNEIDDAIRFIQDRDDITFKNFKILILKLTYEMIQFTSTLETVDNALMDEGYAIISEIEECIFLNLISIKIKDYANHIINSMGKQETVAIESSIKDIIEYIRTNYYEDISLNTIENKYYINASYFSHMFKKITGQNFLTFLTLIRIEAAKKLLVNSELKISDIKERVGYTDSKHFSKLFKKHVGIPPNQFRKKYSKKD